MTKLEVAANDYAFKNHSWLKDALPTLAAVESFERGAEWRDANLWHDAQGDDLPEIDREVIVIDKMGKVSFGHRPDPDEYITYEYEKIYVKTYDKGGWNIPDVRWWLDAPMPKGLEDLV